MEVEVNMVDYFELLHCEKDKLLGSCTCHSQTLVRAVQNG